jgi:hypothetical protein
MLIDDPINSAEKRMLNALRRHLAESGEIDVDDYSAGQLSDLDRADAALFAPHLLEEVLEAYLNADPGSYLRLRWFLRRITQVGAPGPVEYVASQIERFAPAIVDAVRYLSSAVAYYSGSWEALGDHLIKSLSDPLIRASDYLQVSIIGLFWRVTDLNHVERLLALFQRSGSSDLEVGYIVIRGICDDCDKNKEDRWQEYAAVAASAYTRTLLESMPADVSV